MQNKCIDVSTECAVFISRFHAELNGENFQLCRIIANCTCKGKGRPSQGHDGPKGVTYIAPLSLTSAQDVGGWLTPHLSRFTPRKKWVPIVYEAGCVTGPVWAAREISPSEGTRFPALSESLHRLYYPGPIVPCTAT